MTDAPDHPRIWLAYDLVARLRHGIATAANDDVSEPMSERRFRHTDRISVMAEAADFIECMSPSPVAHADLVPDVAAAVAAEKERIASALAYEATMTPCAEDAEVVRDCAALVRADFSYAKVEADADLLDAKDAEIARLREERDTNATDMHDELREKDAEIARLRTANAALLDACRLAVAVLGNANAASHIQGIINEHVVQGAIA